MGFKDLPTFHIYLLKMPDDFEFGDEARVWLFQHAGAEAVEAEIYSRAFEQIRSWQHSPRVEYVRPDIFRFTDELDRLHFKLRWF